MSRSATPAASGFGHDGAVAGIEDTLAQHLRAVRDRDLPAYSATLHDDVVVIVPSGARLVGRAAVEDFHREWFTGRRWVQDLAPLHSTRTPAAAVEVFRADYRDVDDDGVPYARTYLLSLVFARCDDRWLLVHDQCTPAAP